MFIERCLCAISLFPLLSLALSLSLSLSRSVRWVFWSVFKNRLRFRKTDCQSDYAFQSTGWPIYFKRFFIGAQKTSYKQINKQASKAKQKTENENRFTQYTKYQQPWVLCAVSLGFRCHNNSLGFRLCGISIFVFVFAFFFFFFFGVVFFFQIQLSISLDFEGSSLSEWE